MMMTMTVVAIKKVMMKIVKVQRDRLKRRGREEDHPKRKTQKVIVVMMMTVKMQRDRLKKRGREEDHQKRK